MHVRIRIGQVVLTNIAMTVSRQATRIKSHSSRHRQLSKRLIDIVQENTTSNIWKCPLDGFGNEFYWCGDERRPNTIKCHTDAEFGSVVIWTTGTPVTIASPPTASDSTTAPIFGGSITKSTPSEPTNESLQARSGGSSTIVTTGATSVIYRNQTVAGNKSSTTSMAIGAGLGVPLGIVSFGLIGYLFLRNRSRKNDAPAHVPQPSMDNRVKSPRSPRICHELIGDVNPSELPALPSIYEI